MPEARTPSYNGLTWSRSAAENLLLWAETPEEKTHRVDTRSNGPSAVPYVHPEPPAGPRG